MTIPYSINRLKNKNKSFRFSCSFLLTCCYFLFASHFVFSQTPDSWSRKSDFPGNPRQDAAAFTSGNSGYVIAGKDSSGNLLDEVWKYDVTSDNWTQLNDFPGGTRCGATAFTLNDTGYIMCGYDGINELKDCWRYDRITDTWSRMQDLGASLIGSYPGRSHATGLGTSNFGYVLCGYDGSPGYLKQSLRYDPLNDTSWTVARNLGNVSDLTLFGRRWGSGFVIGNTLYYGTGFTFSQDIRKDIWRYDAPLASWVQVADLPDIRSNAFGFSLYGKGYIGCGTNGSYRSDVWRYSPSDNSWTRVADIPGGSRVNASCFTIGNRAYVSGGQHSTGSVYADLWEYTPDSTVSAGKAPEIPPLNVYQRDGQLVISIPGIKNEEINCELYSVSGQLLRSIEVKSATTTIPISDLPEKILLYTLICLSENWILTEKIIISQ
ncbi:MAG: Kelch repeat-containing protein [Bacteroidota bacterium]